jgi:orotidine-5'-phosphate decarboxylase
MNPVLHKLERRIQATASLLCIGLDPEIDKLPQRFRNAAHPQFEFNRYVIEQTHQYAAVYKPNTAFYEARGTAGIDDLHRTMEFLRSEHPDIVTICDAKRADIGNTNRGYAHFCFDWLGCDSVTLHPYLGREALAPFLEREDKASIILCRTSNPGAGDIQDLSVAGRPLWQAIAEKVSQQWNIRGNCMLVVGATYPEEMSTIRKLAPELTFLVPGIGAQGGSVQDVITAGLDARGLGLMLSSSREILFSENPAATANATHAEIAAAREAVLGGVDAAR